MEKIEIPVMRYYGRSWYFPFMPHELFSALEDAFLHDQLTAIVSKEDFQQMIRDYMAQLSN